MSQLKDYYQILELPYNATEAQISEQYKKVKRAYDLNNVAIYSLLNEEECAGEIEKIEEAYNILSHPEKRRQYNKVKGINIEISKDSIEEKRQVEKTPEIKSMAKLAYGEKFSLKFDK